jgi:hypothetical protein
MEQKYAGAVAGTTTHRELDLNIDSATEMVIDVGERHPAQPNRRRRRRGPRRAR